METDVLDKDQIDGLEYIPGDVISKLYKDHDKDVLFEIIQGLDRTKEIITDKMRQALNEERLYGTGEAAIILDVNRSTISTWVKVLMDYIEPEVDGRTYKLNYKALFRVKMISMLREENQYTIGKIKELTIGNDVIDSSDLEEDREKILSVRVKELEASLSNMEKEMILHRKMTQILFSAIDKDILLELQDTDDISGAIVKFREKLLPAPTVTKDEIESIVKESEKSIYENVEKQIENSNLSMKEEIKKEWASISKDQIEELKQQMAPKKGFFSRLFGK